MGGFHRPIVGIGFGMSSDASSFDMPRPDRVTNPAEFIAAMRALRGWAKLTYRQIERRAQQAGDHLPHSTIATALSRNRIPRESTIASFVRACGGDRHVVEVWLAARRRITVSDKAVGHLAYAVEAWLNGRNRFGGGGAPNAVGTGDTPEQRTEIISSYDYAQGNLARAVSESKGERWVGLHRRPRQVKLRKLVRKDSPG